MKHTLLKMVLLVCALALVCVGLTACNNDPANTDTPDTTESTIRTTETHPTLNLVDATGSPLLGIWTVESEKTAITQLKFSEDGSAIITADNGVLGGTFVLEGDHLTIALTGSVMEGTATIEGDTVTFVTANDTLTLTKAQ